MKDIWFESPEDSTLMEIVKNKMGYTSNSKSKNLIKSGCVEVNEKLVQIPSAAVQKGENIHISPEKYSKNIRKKTVELPVEPLFQDEHYIIFEKDALKPLFSKGKFRGLLDEIKRYYKSIEHEEDIFVVNPIPFSGSGLVIIALSLKSSKLMLESLKKAEMRYYALCEGIPEAKEGEIEANIEYNNIGKAYVIKGEEGRPASTSYEVIKASKLFSLLRLKDNSKVKNQINAHLASIKTPIVGEGRDGKKKKNQRVCLHLFSVKLIHPYTQQEIAVKTRVPREFLNTVKQ